MQSRVFAPRLGGSQKKRDIRIFFYYFFQRNLLFRRAGAVRLPASVGGDLSGASTDAGTGPSGGSADAGTGLSGGDADAGTCPSGGGIVQGSIIVSI